MKNYIQQNSSKSYKLFKKQYIVGYPTPKNSLKFVTKVLKIQCEVKITAKVCRLGSIHLWHPVDGARGVQVKNGQNSDGSGWLQGEGGGDPQKLDVQSYN